MTKKSKGRAQASDYLAMTLAARRKPAPAAAKKAPTQVQSEPTPELEAEIDRIKTLSPEALEVYERYLMDLTSLDDSGKLYCAGHKPQD
jgi:hypothetical protein